MSIVLILLAVIAFVGFSVVMWGIGIYNKLVTQRQKVEEGWSGIDVQLKRRIDLIPNLVNAVKGYMTHEKGTLEEVIGLRNQLQAPEGMDAATRAQVEGKLSGALGRLMVTVEQYPDLKANTNVLSMQEELADIEEQIQLSRRYYNGAARDMNTMVEVFPNNLIAGNFGFKRAEYFEVDDPAERQAPVVDLT